MTLPDLRGRLAELRRCCLPFAGLGERVYHPVAVRPSLGFSLVPRPRDRSDRSDSALARQRSAAELVSAALHPAQPGGAGLVEGAKSESNPIEASRRQGLEGISAAGARTVEDLCSLVRQDRGLYGIWTVTLPVEVARVIDSTENGAQVLGDTIRRAFGQMLRRACSKESKAVRFPVPDHWWFVAEPQKAGRIHWHYVFRCKARRGRRWLLGKGKLDRLIASAFRVVTGQAIPATSAGNVQALRSDPGRYLSKYLRKGHGRNGAEAVLAGGWSLNMVPHRWWGCSTSARAFLRIHCFELPAVAVGWLSLQWPKLAAVGAIDARIWTPPNDGAPSIVCGRWLSIDNLERVVAHLFGLADRSYPLGRTFGVT